MRKDWVSGGNLFMELYKIFDKNTKDGVVDKDEIVKESYMLIQETGIEFWKAIDLLKRTNNYLSDKERFKGEVDDIEVLKEDIKEFINKK